ncbi:UNVERIFIED_CONTAM: hypothetical protein FKN15_078494 [Acipenser sinensis]
MSGAASQEWLCHHGCLWEGRRRFISGVWLFRGQQLAFEDCDSQFCDDWRVDYGLYSWRKLDPDGEESKTLMEYLCWEGEFKHVGKPFNQGKIFK